jgi:hypothetical protein
MERPLYLNVNQNYNCKNLILKILGINVNCLISSEPTSGLSGGERRQVETSVVTRGTQATR